MNHEPERQFPVRYTIMPDYGGAYGWINREGTDALGPNHADTSGWGGDHPISEELQESFAAWQTEFERAQNDWEAGIALLDWPRFHERGMALARRLKAELGDAARIYYEKPVEDPNQRVNERVEILADCEWRSKSAHFWRSLKTGRATCLRQGRATARRSGPFTPRGFWMLSHGCERGGWALTAMQTGCFSSPFLRGFAPPLTPMARLSKPCFLGACRRHYPTGYRTGLFPVGRQGLIARPWTGHATIASRMAAGVLRRVAPRMALCQRNISYAKPSRPVTASARS